ncbi:MULTISPECIES: heme NO-binding domain-containing protein [Burkholderiaceae]|uniref:heme NO-binding domain-containing protein n=1 Tax=Burkholderiaceae TaxID=119060 RepID=UPI00142488DD|nr:heme NO-binding protein [Burkholderia sp. Ax-1724]NIF77943.1 heme NO-binding protein [Paraburkholderia sp. Cy-641]
MKGIVFNLLEELVRREHGEDAWDDLLDAAHVQGAYTSLGSYPDAEIARLVAAASVRLALPPADVLHWFGRQAMPLLAEKYSVFFAGHNTTHSFVLTLNSIIHPEVCKLYPGAVTPVFDFDTSTPGVLTMGYRSPRRLCALAHGFIEGAADHYGERLVYRHVRCMHHGDDQCLSHLQFEPHSH